MKVKKRILGIIFFLIALVSAFLMFQLANKTREVIQIPVIRSDLAVGQEIQEKDILMKEVGAYNISEDFILKKEDLVSKYAAMELKKNRPVFKDQVVRDPSMTNITKRIQDKALAISVNLVTSVGGLVRPDSFVQLGIIKKGEQGEALTEYPENLRAVRVLKVLQDNGKDTQSVEEENRTSELKEQVKPAVLVLDVNDKQIESILPYQYAGNIHCILLNDEIAKKEREKRGLQ